MKIPGSRLDFEESWLKLYEMPMGISDLNLYDTLIYNLKEMIEYGNAKIIDCGDNLYKTNGKDTVFYWIGSKTDINVIAEVSVTAQNITINSVAKKTPGSKPYATDLYIAMLKDSNKNALRFQSDTKLTRGGLKIWERLLDQGYSISLYDSNVPGCSFKSIRSKDELHAFFKENDPAYLRYQFILSKQGELLGEVHGYFNTRRMRELTGNL